MKKEIDEIKFEDELEKALGEEEDLLDFPGNATDIEEAELVDIESFAESVSSDDPMKMYLKDIGNIPLLELDEEKKLANIVVKGREAKQKIEDFEKCLIDLSDKEETKYRKMVEDAFYAKNKLVDSNLRLVVSIAKKYIDKGLSLADLIQEGSIGLMMAVDKFEPDKGYKFSTYATWWVRQAITRALTNQSRTIRLSAYMVDIIKKLHKEQEKLAQELSREPNIEELAERMNMHPKRIEEIQKIAQEPLSLEKPVGEEEDSSLADFISYPNGNDPYEYTSNEMLKDEMEYFLKSLSPIEEKVLRLRFYCEKNYTYEEVGEILQLKSHRVRQIEKEAFFKIKEKMKGR